MNFVKYLCTKILRVYLRGDGGDVPARGRLLPGAQHLPLPGGGRVPGEALGGQQVAVQPRQQHRQEDLRPSGQSADISFTI